MKYLLPTVIYTAVKNNYRSFFQTQWWPALALAIAALAVVASPGPLICGSAHASDTTPSDYCYQTDVVISYTGVPTLTNYAFRVPVAAASMISASQMDARAWDMLPIQGSLSNEIDVLAQDLGSTAAGWWIHLPTIEQNQSKTARIYTGSPEQKRNQGILFTGSDALAATDNVAMDIADDLDLRVEIEVLDATAIDATLATHYNTGGGDGYRMLLVDDLGTLKVRAQADVHTCDITWNSGWTNSNQEFTMRFLAAAGNDLFLDRNGVNEAACDTDLASITAPGGSPDFESGDGLENVIIRDIRLVDSGVVAGHWGFHPRYMAESSWVDPTATGTVDDQGPNNLDITYTFTRSQTGITVLAGSVQLQGSSPAVTLSSTQTEILGDAFADDITVRPSEVQTGILYDLFVDPIASGSDAGIPRDMAYAIAMGGLGMFLAVFVYMKIRFTPIALGIGGVPPAIGMINGWIPTWWILLWVILIVTSWFSIRHQEQA